MKYQAYGLCIASEIPLPDLPTTEASPDVWVRFGEVPEGLEAPRDRGALFETGQDRFLLRLDDIGRYLVSDGREVLVEPAPGSTQDDVRLFLLGSAFGALLMQRGLLPLHASCIDTPQGAVAFIGPSGHGKSTLAATFQQRGYRVLADDTCAITFDKDGVPEVLPGLPCVKLWADAAEQLAYSTDALRRVRPSLEKYAIPIASAASATRTPLAAVYVLESTNYSELTMEPLNPMQAVQAFVAHTYRAAYVYGLGLEKRHFEQVMNTARHVRTVQLSRSMKAWSAEQVADRIEAGWS